MTRRCASKVVVSGLLAAAASAGCATQTITASLPKVAAVESEPGRVEGSPADIYALIAAGSLGCWFAVNGQLKKSHIFHADVDPPSKGGAVEIAVHERDQTGQSTWGSKAFKISLVASGGQTEIEIQNLKMPEDMAKTMRADAFGWAQGSKECRLKPIELPPPPEPPKKKVKGKVKAAAK